MNMKNTNGKNEMKNYRLIVLASAIILSMALATPSNAQTVLYNDGGFLHTDGASLLFVDGDIQNKDTAHIENDGVIELTGDLSNDITAKMVNGADDASTERAYKFIGPSAQWISGDLSDNSDRYIYNLIIDKANSGAHVGMQTDVNVKGSLVFGSSTVGSATYTPTVNSTLTDHAGNGIINTYDLSNTDHELFITNDDVNAVAGYAALVINAAPRDAYIQTRGAQGQGLGGFARNVSTTGVPYVFPVGSVTNGYNAAALTFTTIGGGTDKVRSMFVDATGGVGSISQYCSGCGGSLPDNNGFNYLFNSSSCLGSTPQWVIFDALPQDHGYWSYEGNSSDHYLIEAYPNSFPGFSGSGDDTWRLIKKSATIDAIPSGDWTSSITSSITDTSDLLAYTRNGGCYSGDGVPGGMYTGFSHFQMARTSNFNTLPVELISLAAQAIQNKFIQVTWATSVEINNSGFEVLRSINGTDFVKIGFVAAKGDGNNTSQSNYSFDDNLVETNVQYYYMLKQIDKDNQFKYSPIVQAELNADDTPKVTDCFPNPANGRSSIMINATVETTFSFDLYDITGQLIKSSAINVVPGYNRFDFETSQLAQGSYKVVVKSDRNIFTRNLNILR